MAKFINVDFERKFIRNVYEHETLLSFNSDLANEAFQEWWYNEGSELFNNWLKNSEKYNKLANCSPQEAFESYLKREEN
jgi:hypothetical protein